MVPGRIGSQRFKKKNFALLNGKPLMSYALENANNSGIFDRVILNGDSNEFKKISELTNTEFYLRKEMLGSSETKSDDVVYDFIENFGGDIIAWVNPICPLNTSNTIKDSIKTFIVNDYDSAITGRSLYTHSSIEGRPINFNTNNKFEKTQDLKPIFSFCYSLMIWKKKSFVKEYEKSGKAFIFGKFGQIEVDYFSSLMVKYEDDLKIIEKLYPLVYL